MATTDIIGVNLEFWFGVNAGALSEQQIGISLVGFYALGVGVHHDFAIEHCSGGVGGQAFVQLIGVAVGLCVVNPGVVVHKSISAGQIAAVEGATAVLSALLNVQVIP